MQAPERAALLEEVFRQAPTFLHVLRGHDLVFELANPAYYQLVGHRELLGRSAFDVMPEAMASGEYPARIRAVMTSCEPFIGHALPVTLARTPGAPPEERLVDLVYLPLLDPDGSCQRVLGHGTDVTDRERARQEAEAALRASEARFRSIAESGVVALAFFDLTGGIVDANDAFLGMVGYSREELAAGMVRWDRLTPLEWMPRTREALEEFRRTGRIEPYEKEYFRRDGARFWALFAGGLVGTGGEGVAIVLDISARKRAEAARVENEARQAFLLALTDALRDVHDPAGVQEAATRVLGERLGADRAYYVEVDEARAEFVVEREWHREGASSHVRRYALDARAMPWLADRRPWVVADLHADVAMPHAQRARCRANDIAAFVVVPLVRRGRLVATLAVNQRTPRAWTAGEVALVEEVAQRTWAAVEHARAEATLRETQRRLDEALATARMAYWQRDMDTGRTISSPATAVVYGLCDDERIESAVEALALLHPDDGERHRALVDGATARGQGWHAEFRIVRPRDGEVAWLEEVATVVRDPASGAAHCTGLVWDVTDRRRAAAAAELERRTAERDELRREMAAVEETERRRLARELHDQLGQQLTAVSLGLEEATRLATREDARDGTHADGTHADGTPPDGTHADGEAPLLRRLRQLATLARSTMAGARYLALELRPPELDDEGFERALQTYVTEWTARFGVEAEALVVGETAGSLLPLDVGSALYRVSQEALTNAAKHAGATTVSVIVERTPGEVRLIIEDDGRGFDPAEVAERARRERRLGLSGIRERAALLGGFARVESSPGNGTTVFVRVPVPHLPASEEPAGG